MRQWCSESPSVLRCGDRLFRIPFAGQRRSKGRCWMVRQSAFHIVSLHRHKKQVLWNLVWNALPEWIVVPHCYVGHEPLVGWDPPRRQNGRRQPRTQQLSSYVAEFQDWMWAHDISKLLGSPKTGHRFPMLDDRCFIHGHHLRHGESCTHVTLLGSTLGASRLSGPRIGWPVSG